MDRDVMPAVIFHAGTSNHGTTNTQLIVHTNTREASGGKVPYSQYYKSAH